MSIHALAVAGIRDILHVRIDRFAEERDALLRGNVRIRHGGAESDALRGDGPAGFRAALLEAAGGGGLVGRSVDVVHLVVGELDDHLDVGVRGSFEFLDQVLAVALVGLDPEVVLGDQGIEFFSGAEDFRDIGSVEVEFQGQGFRQVGADGRGGEVEFVGEYQHVYVVVQSVSGRAVHHAVFAEETGGAVLIDDEFKRFVVPPILSVAVPVLVRALFEGNRRGIVKAHNKGGRLDGFECSGIGWVGRKEPSASGRPDVTILGSERADSGSLFGDGEDSAELRFELGGIESLATDLVKDLVKLVFADHDKVRVILMGVFHGMIPFVEGNPTAVEHPLVCLHTYRQLLHVFGF